MIINKLIISHFGKFHNKELNLNEGINLIYGKNEAGKSTLHSFIKGMLFGIEKGRGRTSKESMYDRYLPWDAPGSYQGSMEINVYDIPYRISRSFYQKEKSFSMIRMDTGREVLSGEDELTDIIPNLTESNFNNTVSIKQSKAETDIELAKEVQNYIANLTTAKNSEVNVGEALNELLAKRKEYEAAISSINLELIEERIEKCLFNEDMQDRLYLKKMTLKSNLEAMKKQHNNHIEKSGLLTEQEIRKLYEIKNRAGEYESLLLIADELWTRENEIREEIIELDQELNEITNIKEKLNQAVRIEDEKKAAAIEYDKLKALAENEAAKIKKKKNIIIKACITSCILALALIVFFGFISSFNINALGIAAVSTVLVTILMALVITIIIVGKQWKKCNIKHMKYSEGIKTKRAVLSSLTKEYESILKACGCINIDEMNALYERSAVIRSRKSFLKERCIEINEESLAKSNKADELMDDITSELLPFYKYNESEMDYIQNEDILEQIQKLITDNEQVKKELNVKRIDFEEEYKKEEEAVRVIESELMKFENSKDNLYELREQHKEESEKLKRLSRELSAIKLAADTIKKLSLEIHDSFGTELNKKISKLSEIITLSSYTEAAADEKLSIKVFNGLKYVDLNKLSTGTIEQIYLALRLSVSDLLFEDKMPLILDDSFVNYDSDRLEAVLKLIHELDRQVLLFTCSDREQLILNDCGILYNLVSI